MPLQRVIPARYRTAAGELADSKAMCRLAGFQNRTPPWFICSDRTGVRLGGSNKTTLTRGLQGLFPQDTYLLRRIAVEALLPTPNLEATL